jgi:hypothetical protein
LAILSSDTGPIQRGSWRTLGKPEAKSYQNPSKSTESTRNIVIRYTTQRGMSKKLFIIISFGIIDTITLDQYFQRLGWTYS